MSPAEFLQELEGRAIRLKVENDQLRFFAKPGALTPELRAAIVERKAELIACLRNGHQGPVNGHAPDVAPIPKAPRDRPLPLASAQQRLWYLDQIGGPSPTYNISEGYRLRGPLDTAALDRAIQQVVQRHEALRIKFVAGAEAPRATLHVSPSLVTPLELVDVSHLTEAGRLDAALASARDFARSTFSLVTGPLIRWRLIRLAPDDHVFAFVVHHIIFDAWSAGIVLRELETFYAAEVQRSPVSVPPSAIDFVDYAVWENELLAGNGMQPKLEFWRSYLDGAATSLDLPGDVIRADQSFVQGDSVTADFAPDVVQRLRALGRGERATLYHVALTAWMTLLCRYSGQTDFLVGTSVSNRKRPELEDVVGFLVNTLPIRARLTGEPTVREAVRKTRESALEALEHDDVPFDRIVQARKSKRGPDAAPLLDTFVSYLQSAEKPPRFHNLECSPLNLDPNAAKFALSLWLTESGDTLRVILEFATGRFSRSRAERMLQHYRTLLEAMADMPETAVTRLPMLDATERSLVLEAWNQTTREYPRDRCVHELFEAQAQRAPEAVALVFGEAKMTYGELNRRADDLARLLRGHGVGPDVLVGLCLERGFDMIIGMLGILKAGAAYVPIDPAYPRDRIAFVLEDSRAPVLITQRSLAKSLPAGTALQVFLDEPLPTAPSPATASLPKVGPSNLAYVIFTSGSTGKPKGVQIEHRAVVNFLNAMRSKPGLQADDVLLAVTTLSFDIAGLEVHLPLTTGARIVIAPWKVTVDGPALLRTIEREGVTLLQATPATWRLLLSAGWSHTPRLKALCGGEAMPADLAAQMIPRCAEVWNMYGPTETTIWSTCARVTDAQDIHIGRPIDNTDLYILDAHQQPQPVGLAGELLIGGDGLARGYLNKPELTADRFIPHPFKPGQRLYRTGDLARYRPDGNVDCLGRMDFQVKIRGFRIELGEIETQLSSHPDVNQSVVIAREDTPGDKRLVAYFTSRDSVTPEASALRSHLRGKLPEYMIPAVYVPMPELPLTPNGKIDRKALPAPSAPSSPAPVVPSVPAVVATGDVQKKLIAIFEEVLNAPVTSTTDSFFDLGGHSLSALTLVAAINRVFGAHITPASLFEDSTIAGLTARLGGGDDGAAEKAEEAAPNPRVMEVLARIEGRRTAAARPAQMNARMQESWFCKIFLAPLYAVDRRSLRLLLTRLILRMEGGATFSVTMRKLFARYHDIRIGDYSAVTFSEENLKARTKIGRYCSIFHTAVFQNAEHPRNTVSTHGLFYHPAFGFTEGYPLERVQIEVGNDVWIGNDAKILFPTKKIGDGAIIAAGAVVVEDVPPYAIVGGYPAKVLRYRFSKKTIEALLASRWWEASLDELHGVRDQFMVPLEGQKIR